MQTVSGHMFKAVRLKAFLSKAAMLLLVAGFNSGCAQNRAYTSAAAEIDKQVDLVLERLYAESPAALDFSTRAKGILVFPDVIKFGLVVGGQYGKGAMVIDGKISGYYRTASALYGVTMGSQTFGYAMFLMTDQALSDLQQSSGWEFGVGLNAVFVDKALAGSMTTLTAKDDIYVFVFGQKGLMLDLGHFEGAKITKVFMNNE